MSVNFSMKGIVLGVLGIVAALISLFAAFLLVTGVVAVVEAEMRPPTAPCGGAVVFGNGGSQCDGPIAPDGSFQRCTSVYVLGFGGWSCYTVYP